MRPDDIKHFLIVYDIPSAHAEVRQYGTDYDAALAAYAQAEWDTSGHTDVEVVLLGADSLETIKYTHSSYFGSRKSFEEFLPAEILGGRRQALEDARAQGTLTADEADR